jgi:hypothetical protein
MPVEATRRSRSPTKTTRSPLACERCRSKKLRCVGGNPCNGCVRASVSCDYGGGVKDREDQLGGIDMGVRVSQLEKQVALLMAKLEQIESGAAIGLPGPFHTTGTNQPHTIAPEPVGWLSSNPQDSSSRSTARDAASPRQTQFRASPADRLIQVILPSRGLNAPFPPLMYHPAVWDNRSRSQTPEDSTENRRGTMGVTDFEAKAKVKDDPVNTGLISHAMGERLFNL